LKKSLNGPLIETACRTRFFDNPLFEIENPGGIDLNAASIGHVGLKKCHVKKLNRRAMIVAPAWARTRMNADPIYSAISVCCAGPANGRSSIRIMQIDAMTIMAAEAPNT
jgi:hypothetical protein